MGTDLNNSLKSEISLSFSLLMLAFLITARFFLKVGNDISYEYIVLVYKI